MALLGKHKSMGKALKRSVQWLESLAAVKKVVLGFSESCRHKYSPGHIRFKMDVDGGIKANGYSGNGVTDMFIKIDPIDEREHVKQKISEKFN